MKTAAEYIKTVYGTRTFARAVDVNDNASLIDLMQDFSDRNVKELTEMLTKISLSLEMFSPPTKEIALAWSEEINQLIKKATT